MIASAGPVLSVIIPTYRDSARLALLLAALRVQETVAWSDVELVIVDNDPSGPDPVPELPSLPFAVTLLGCERSGSYAARNAGVGVATGRFLVFTDADCRPASDWLAAIMQAITEKPDSILAGEVRMDPGPAPNRWAVFDTVRGIPQAAFVRRGYGATANLTVPRGVFDQLGGFADGRLSGGDAEFCRRAGAQGIAISFLPEAVVYHPARDTRLALVTKARRIKGGQVATGPVARRILWSIRSLVPPLREMTGYLVSRYPLVWRLCACQVRLELWGVELAELVRLVILRHPPERR